MKKIIVLYILIFSYSVSYAVKKKPIVDSVHIVRTTLIMNTIIALDCQTLQDHGSAISFYVKNVGHKKKILNLVRKLKPTAKDAYNIGPNNNNNEIDARARILISYKGKRKKDTICLNNSIILLNGTNMNCNYNLINYIYSIID